LVQATQNQLTVEKLLKLLVGDVVVPYIRASILHSTLIIANR